MEMKIGMEEDVLKSEEETVMKRILASCLGNVLACFARERRSRLTHSNADSGLWRDEERGKKHTYQFSHPLCWRSAGSPILYRHSSCLEGERRHTVRYMHRGVAGENRPRKGSPTPRRSFQLEQGMMSISRINDF
ncbi:hypothetical protein CDAR_387811 [Caerostris darwini]|uniref:Uncharacterized protein n=1 Tax=Caerostris darwini TaxID=1538125 RepID=A0AAV4SX50_9ARAC|nr:hypothetical protein CDAR_387811 [Caerostris darwini]